MNEPIVKTKIEEHFKSKSKTIIKYLDLAKNMDSEFVVLNISDIQLKEGSDPSDIDLLVDEFSYECFKQILINDGFRSNFRYTGTDQFILERYECDYNHMIRFHFHVGFKFYGICFFDLNDCISACNRDQNGWLIPSSAIEYNFLLIEYFFRKKHKYKNFIKKHNLFRMNGNDSDVQQHHKKLLSYIENLVKTEENISLRIQFIYLFKAFGADYKIYSTIFQKILSKTPFFYGFSRRGRGKLIFFMGVDGSGKTTLLGKLAAELANDGYPNKVLYWGLKTTFLHRLKNLIFKKKFRSSRAGLSSLPVGFPQRVYLSNKILAQVIDVLLTLYYCIEYYFICVRNLGYLREENYLLIDRGFYDRLSPDFPLSNKLVFLLLPKPALIVRLDGDSEIFFQRKMEYSVHDLDKLAHRVREAMSIISGHDIPIVELDTSRQSVSEAVLFLRNHLLKS